MLPLNEVCTSIHLTLVNVGDIFQKFQCIVLRTSNKTLLKINNYISVL